MFENVFDHIQEFGINEAYGLCRFMLGIECDHLVDHPARSDECTGNSSLRGIVAQERELRGQFGNFNLVLVWIIIDGALAEIKRCVESVRKECPENEEMLFDFVTTEVENDFLDGSMSLVIPATGQPV
jgi:hypothetical protein